MGVDTITNDDSNRPLYDMTVLNGACCVGRLRKGIDATIEKESKVASPKCEPECVPPLVCVGSVIAVMVWLLLLLMWRHEIRTRQSFLRLVVVVPVLLSVCVTNAAEILFCCPFWCLHRVVV